jgi:hypothetical protein
MTVPHYVYDGNIDKLALAVEKLNKRAAKLGVPAIQLHIGEREVCFTCAGAKGPTVSLNPEAWGDGADVLGHERATVVLVGEPPKLNGWTFAAVVDHLSNGTITRYPQPRACPTCIAADDPECFDCGGTGRAAQIDLTPYWGVDPTCDHCNTARLRHETFIVVHDTGDEKRVGRNCLADFLGHHNPAALIGHLNLYAKAFALIEGAEEAGFDTGVTMLDLATFLAYVAAMMRTHGWCSRGKAYEEGHHGATADLAQHAYWTNPLKPVIKVEVEDGDRGRKALDWARALTDADVGDNDYLYNLRAVCTDDYVRPKRGGLAGSVIVAAERAFEKAAALADDAQKSNEHIGNVKERLTLALTLTGTRDIEGYYGSTTLHKFEDAAGNLFIWFATNARIIPEDDGRNDRRCINLGETFTLAGTVKGHDDYKGRLQTKLTRVGIPPKPKAKKRAAKKAAA